ncbi:LysR family transcriptional regulator [Kineosporia succinea]|uniref:DNA-binding transcriptional LysR family regulator n=1 Tax=Kineosporia succinea TaxID=84632 RepID=A0ABT9P241_9ACTN|nr:LysR family transcriptional regulator [Kineosporia succinea]MDP9826750.1 DNA-binding transcriptional LysR family regulator [Kineosporia succinea]
MPPIADDEQPVAHTHAVPEAQVEAVLGGTGPVPRHENEHPAARPEVVAAQETATPPVKSPVTPEPEPEADRPVLGEGSATLKLDPRRLLVFREVAHSGSMAAAARTLGWTQPAVSQHIRKLEKDLGLALITRVGRGIALTDPGQLLLRHADAIDARLEAAGEALADLARRRTGRVRIAAFPSASATLVSKALMSLGTDHPGLDVRLTQVEPPEALVLIAEGQCDLAIVFDYPGEEFERGPLDAVQLLRDPLHAVIGPENPLAGRDSVTMNDLAGQRWIAGCVSCRKHLVREAVKAGFTPDIRHSTDDYVVVQALVAAGLAVAALPGMALAASLNPSVKVVPLEGYPSRTVSAVLAPSSHGVPAVEAVLEQLRAAARPGRISA